MTMLKIAGIETFYGKSQALFGVDLAIAPGEVVTLMGRNGMGKTTTVRTVMGQLAPRRGTVHVRGRDVTGWPSYRIARLGVGYVPEGRQVFPNLTVRENLVATAANYGGAADPWTEERVMTLFPRLAERANQSARTLSGGEQQMVAIGRALMTNPVLVILDEATDGLAPLIRDEIWQVLETGLKAPGRAILVIDKNPEILARIANRHYVMEKGMIVWSGDSAALRADTAMQHRYLGV
jgi:branched-chain amino acid transport system ATP-binding protein